MIKRKKWIIEINNNKIIVENRKEFTKFVALKVLRKHRVIKNEKTNIKKYRA